MNFLEILGQLLSESGFAALLGANGGEPMWQNGVMIILSFVLLYMAIVKKFEPLLLLPIAFGIFLSNLPLGGTFYYFYSEVEHWQRWQMIAYIPCRECCAWIWCRM